MPGIYPEVASAHKSALKNPSSIGRAGHIAANFNAL